MSKKVKRTTKSYDQLMDDLITAENKIMDEFKKSNIGKVMLFAECEIKWRRIKRGEPIEPEYKKHEPEIRKFMRMYDENWKRFTDRVRELGKHKEVIAQTSAAKLGGSAMYGNIEFQFTKVEKGTELSGSKAPAGVEYLMIYFRAVNKGKKQAFFDPDSVVSLICGAELIPLRNYRMETSLDVGASCEGQFFFRVPEEAKSFTLQFGKKTEKKKKLEIKI